MTPEGKVKAEVKKILKQYDVWYFMPVAGRSVGGVPDFICCVQGQFLAIETKAGSGQLTPLQKATLISIDRAGGSTLVIHPENIESLRTALLMLHTK